MPRALGQIDVRKNEAILEAAVEIFAERGVSAPIEAVARRAGVSKQTIYNHYRSKAELMRTLIVRRRSRVTQALNEARVGSRPEETLTAYAKAMLEAVLTPTTMDIVRVAVSGSRDAPEIARALYEAGPQTSRSRLAEFLEVENRAGRLAVDDPEEAAELFVGMVAGARQLSALLGTDVKPEASWAERRARTCAARFVRAYAPEPLVG